MLAGATSLFLATVVTWFAGLRVNLSGSMPIGLYRVSSEPAAFNTRPIRICLRDPVP